MQFAKHLFILLVFATPSMASAITIDTVPIGNPGNAADMTIMNDGTSGYGSVGYAYNIGTYEVTNKQYTEFLNAKDPTGLNTLGLYTPAMGTDSKFGGISFNFGNPDGSKYDVSSGHANQPVNYVSWYDALRFANWLNNGQGNGDTESGAYTLQGGTPTPSNGNSIIRNAGARVFLPNEDEWHKAAYFDSGPESYFRYPTGSNSVPTAGAPPGSSNSANYHGAAGDLDENSAGNLTDVGSYTGTRSPYGAFDMAGNVWEWTETGVGGSYRVVRGDSVASDSHYLLNSSRGAPGVPPSYEWYDVGFRVASVPEPSTVVLTLVFCGLMGAATKRSRCRGRADSR